MTPSSTPWRILFSGKRSGAWNMAVDAAVLRGVESGESPPTLRLYGWNPWCVTLGHFQDPAQELDPRALRERGWGMVLRPTGGRAVLHAEEITYSLLARRDEAPWCATLAQSYDHIGQAWAKVLEGFDLKLAKGQTLEKPERGGVALPCFASSSRAELAFGERKVVGSAQRRTRSAFVQHGSIPVTADHERLVETLRLDAARKEAYLRILRRHAVSLGEITAQLGTSTSSVTNWAAWERRLADGLLEALGVNGAAGELTAEEEKFVAIREAEHEERQREFLRSSQ